MCNMSLLAFEVQKNKSEIIIVCISVVQRLPISTLDEGDFKRVPSLRDTNMAHP